MTDPERQAGHRGLPGHRQPAAAGPDPAVPGRAVAHRARARLRGQLLRHDVLGGVRARAGHVHPGRVPAPPARAVAPARRRAGGAVPPRPSRSTEPPGWAVRHVLAAQLPEQHGIAAAGEQPGQPAQPAAAVVEVVAEASDRPGRGSGGLAQPRQGTGDHGQVLGTEPLVNHPLPLGGEAFGGSGTGRPPPRAAPG